MAGDPDERHGMTALVSQTRKLLLTPAGFAVAVGVGSIITVTVLVALLLAGRPEAGSVAPTFRLASEAELRALAPAQLAGLGRTDVRIETADGMNVPATSLDATYRAGARRLDLKIVHSPDLEQVVGFGGADTAAYDRKSAEGSQRRWREAGAIFVESTDRLSGAATFGRVRHNFYVMARGQGGVSLEELRAAVSQVEDGPLPAPKSGG